MGNIRKPEQIFPMKELSKPMGTPTWLTASPRAHLVRRSTPFGQQPMACCSIPFRCTVVAPREPPRALRQCKTRVPSATTPKTYRNHSKSTSHLKQKKLNQGFILHTWTILNKIQDAGSNIMTPLQLRSQTISYLMALLYKFQKFHHRDM